MKELRRKFIIDENRINRLQVISSGGGTQSNCMIVLAHMEVIPRPDIIVMVDTERESSNVFDYQKKYIAPLCDDMGIEYVIVKKSDYTSNDITLASDDEVILPAFFTEFNGRMKNGSCNKQPGFCSGKWKQDPFRRYLNERYGTKELTSKGVDVWIGMSFDEANRVRYPSGKWQHRYPLFEAQILREQAIKIVEDYGLPTPPRSACWMCPNRHDDEWQFMKENVPNDFNAAIKFEKELQESFPWLWLHRSGISIGEIDFIKSSRSNKQIDMFEKHCDTGMCFI
jgi:hypothetical protein